MLFQISLICHQGRFEWILEEDELNFSIFVAVVYTVNAIKNPVKRIFFF